jgi:hypothetical protein
MSLPKIKVAHYIFQKKTLEKEDYNPTFGD